MYCSVSDVEKEFKNTSFTASSKVTDSDVEEMIKEVSAEVDTYLLNTYKLPITNVQDLLVLKGVSKRIVASRIEKLLSFKKDEKLEETSEYKSAMKWLEKVASGKVALQQSRESGKRFASDSDEMTFSFSGDSW